MFEHTTVRCPRKGYSSSRRVGSEVQLCTDGTTRVRLVAAFLLGVPLPTVIWLCFSHASLQNHRCSLVLFNLHLTSSQITIDAGLMNHTFPFHTEPQFEITGGFVDGMGKQPFSDRVALSDALVPRVIVIRN